jgi:hypothetical protein
MCDNDIRDNAEGDLRLHAVVTEAAVKERTASNCTAMAAAARSWIIHRNGSVTAGARERELLSRVESTSGLVVRRVAVEKFQEILRLIVRDRTLPPASRGHVIEV